MSGARGIVAAVLLVSICAAAPALGQGGPRICIVSVENGTPTAADLGQGYRMAGRFIAFPGTSRPIIYPLNREGVWTIDESRAFVPYGGAFPVWRGSLWTKYAFEPLSKRIVAAHMRDVFVAGSDGVFREAGGVDPGEKVAFHSAIHIPRLDRTFLATSHGLRVVEYEAVKPVAGAERSIVGGVHRIFDLPSSPGMVLDGASHKIFLRGDDGAVAEAYVLARARMRSWIFTDSVVSVEELPTPDTLLLRSYHETVLIEIDRTATTVRPRAAHSLQTFSCNRGADGSRELLSTALNTFLVYGRTPDGACSRNGPRPAVRGLERLHGRSFVPVPGGEVRMAGGQPMHDLPTLGIVLLKTVSDVDKGFGNGGLLAYDGDRVTPIPGSGHEEIGDFVRVYDARSLGKVLLLTTKGLYELTTERTIRRIATPPAFSFERHPAIAEMPASRVALLLGDAGVLALDTGGQVHPVKGSERYRYSPTGPPDPSPFMPKTDELLLIGRNGLFLAVDQNLAVDAVCQ
jgi:hypothetical protein